MSSDRAKHWAWKQVDVSRSELLLLLAMADHVGETLLCYAELQNLAAMARMSYRTAQRTAERLVEAGKLQRTQRPGSTTLFRLLIPADFGNQIGEQSRRRKGPVTPDKMTGVSREAPGSEQGRTPDTVSGVTPDKMAGVDPRQNDRGVRTKWPGTPDKMADDSSLNPSLHQSSSDARARAGPASSPARASETQTHGDELVLENRAKLAGITPWLPDEPRDRFLRRLNEAEGRLVIERGERHRREREQAAAAAASSAPCEDAAA